MKLTEHGFKVLAVFAVIFVVGVSLKFLNLQEGFYNKQQRQRRRRKRLLNRDDVLMKPVVLINKSSNVADKELYITDSEKTYGDLFYRFGNSWHHKIKSVIVPFGKEVMFGNKNSSEYKKHTGWLTEGTYELSEIQWYTKSGNETDWDNNTNSMWVRENENTPVILINKNDYMEIHNDDDWTYDNILTELGDQWNNKIRRVIVPFGKEVMIGNNDSSEYKKHTGWLGKGSYKLRNIQWYNKDGTETNWRRNINSMWIRTAS